MLHALTYRLVRWLAGGLILLPVILHADTNYLHELQQQADQRLLSEHPVWQRLLHYKPTWLGGQRSQVDAHNFFLSAHGKTHPKAELSATLAAFFSTQTDRFDRTARCRFPARYAWLKQQLHFDAARMPQSECKDYNTLMKLLQPTGLTLVFPSADPRSPNSMFGHSLLRIDRKGQTASTRMLSYAANFAAQVPEQGDLFYAFKGLLGFYPGKFTLSPYYSKLREYGQMERRDLWEYPLRLTPAQLRMTLDHLYELLSAYYDYYFFKENCAYHVLSALEPALPDRTLTDRFHLWTTPLDTIRVLQQEGLLGTPYFAPSQRRTLEAMEQALTDQQQKAALAMAAAPKRWQALMPTGLNKTQQAAVLDLADEYRRYRQFGKKELDPLQVAASEQTLLLARSRLAIPSMPPHVSAPVPPSSGHTATRLGLFAGQVGQHARQGLRWRAVYHDLSDPVRGYSPHTALRFIDVTAQRLRQRWRMQRLEVLSILSLAPRSAFFHDLSWQMNTGWQRDPIRSRFDYVWLRGGAGYSRFIGGKQQQIWGLLNLEWAGESHGLQRNSLSPGLDLGWHRDSLDQRQASTLRLRWQTPLQRRFKKEQLDLVLKHSMAVGRNQAIWLRWQRQQRWQQWQNSWAIGWRWYL